MEEKFYNFALRFLSYRTRSEKEVREKLKTLIKRHSGLSRIDSGGVPIAIGTPQNDIIEKIIAKLKEKKFIDDEEFARMFLENRLRFKPRSLRLIKLELKQKGIDPETISSLQLTIDSDLENAKKLVRKRIERLRGLGKQKIYEKLGRHLASKGFNWDTIKKAIDTALS